MKGIYPTILNSPKWGKQAKEAFSDAQALIEKIKEEKLWKPIGVTNSDQLKVIKMMSFYMITKAKKISLANSHFEATKNLNTKEPLYSLADFIASISEKIDYIGAFAVTAGDGVERLARSMNKMATIITLSSSKLLVTA